MEDGDHSGRILRFGPFEADLETGELRKDGTKLALQVQPFQVLAILLKHSGELVRREQLRSQIWPEDTFVDFDHALNTTITKIRLTLGDNAEHPMFIETLPRRGYRFIGAVQKPFEFQSQHYYDIYVVDVPAGRPRLLPTFPKSDNGAPNWSHDGKWIYFYSSHENGPFQLWKVPFRGGTPLRVTKNGGVYAIESEDGRFIYYSKFEQPGVWKMPLNGTEEERVLDQPEGYNWFNWALSPTGLYFLNPTGLDKGKIEFFDFASVVRHSD